MSMLYRLRLLCMIEEPYPSPGVLKSGLSERVVAGEASHNTLTQTTFEYPYLHLSSILFACPLSCILCFIVVQILLVEVVLV